MDSYFCKGISKNGGGGEMGVYIKGNGGGVKWGEVGYNGGEWSQKT